MSNNRAQRARDILSDLYEVDDDPRRILVGPGEDEDDFDRIDISHYMATDPRSIAGDLRAEYDLGPVSDPDAFAFFAKRASEDSNSKFLFEDENLFRYYQVAGKDPDIPVAEVAISPDGDLAGLYMRSALLVFPEYRGQGLGKQLVVEQLLSHGYLYVWNLDEASFSPEGEETHLSALRLLEKIAEPEMSGMEP